MLLQRVLPIAALSALLSLGLTAQDKPQPAPSQNVEFPFVGQVTADQLNVRIHPKVDESSTIMAILKTGDEVIVVAEKDGFYSIDAPKGAWAWVWGKNVTVSGDTATIVKGQAPVRIDARGQAKELATVPEGTKMKILKEHLGWYKVEAPEIVKFWVAKKHVRFVRKASEVEAKVVPKVETSSPNTPDPSAAKFKDAEVLVAKYNDMIAQKQLDEVDYTKVAELYDQAAALAKDPATRRRAEEAAKLYRSSAIAIGALKGPSKVMDEQNKKLQDLKDLLDKAKEKQKEMASFAYRGYVDVAGAYYGSLGRHKLLVDNKVKCFLRAKDGDQRMLDKLNGFYQKYVGVKGSVIQNPDGWDGYTVVIVDEVIAISPDEEGTPEH